MKIKNTVWAIALAPAMFILAETTHASQPTENNPREQTQVSERYRRAGGVKRNFQWGRAQREDTPTRDRRAGGVKRNRLHQTPDRIPQAEKAQSTAREVRTTQTSQVVRRAGGAKRNILNRTRPATQRDLTESEPAPTTRRRAGGVKSRF